MQDTHARLSEVAELVFEQFDVPSVLSGYNVSPQRLLKCPGGASSVVRIRTAILALSYEAVGLLDKNVAAYLIANNTSTRILFDRSKVLAKCQYYKLHDEAFRRSYIVCRYRLIGRHQPEIKTYWPELYWPEDGCHITSEMITRPSAA